MKFKNYILAICILISSSSLAQIDVNLSVCGTESFSVVGTDGTGRNIYNNGTVSFAIQWNNTASQWEIVQLPSTVWFTNSFASSPNPPCFGTGTWITVNASCGNIDATTGTCQTVLTGIDVAYYNSLINVYPNPSSGIFSFEGISIGNTIEIFNVLGKLVATSYSENSLSTIDMTGFERGVYFYSVKNKTEIVKKGKLILQ